jgi:hypothetical protein
MGRWKCKRAKDWVGTTCKNGTKDKVYLADQGNIVMFPTKLTDRCLGMPDRPGAWCYFTPAGFNIAREVQRKGIKQLSRKGMLRL